MPEPHITDMLERSSDTTSVYKGRAQRSGSDVTNVDKTRTVTLSQRSENPQAVTSVGWLSASILHDLRNPLGTICAGAELLMNLDSASPQAKRLARNMCGAAVQMRKLLRELASLARHNVSAAEICDIRLVIASASEAALAAMEHQGVQILIDVPAGIDLPLVRSQIERVFFNLIANAFEAMPGGGSIRIRARKTSTYVHVELEDNGPGIPGSISDRLFEPFVTSGKQDGLGLGLALARQTVRNHGGDMWIEQAAGARFVIGLPLDQTYCVLGPSAASHNAGNPIAA